MSRRSTATRPTWWMGGWVAPAVALFITIFWVLAFYWLIGDRSGQLTWQYGTPPYVPAESIATTTEPEAGPPPSQIELPKSPTGGQNVPR